MNASYANKTSVCHLASQADIKVQTDIFCYPQELGEPRLTDCIYQVSDADGEISTRFMTFEVSSERNDEDIFYMKGTNIPENWYIMNMTVGIYSPLNFETNALHVFQVTAFVSIEKKSNSFPDSCFV